MPMRHLRLMQQFVERLHPLIVSQEVAAVPAPHGTLPGSGNQSKLFVFVIAILNQNG